MTNPPKPYLNLSDREERLQILGIGKGEAVDSKKLTALRELLAAAIADWADLDLERGYDLDAELRDWAIGWTDEDQI